MSNNVTTSENNMRAQVMENEDQYLKKPVVYEFGNGRQILSTDHTNSGIYGPNEDD